MKEDMSFWKAIVREVKNDPWDCISSVLLLIAAIGSLVFLGGILEGVLAVK